MEKTEELTLDDPLLDTKDQLKRVVNRLMQERKERDAREKERDEQERKRQQEIIKNVQAVAAKLEEHGRGVEKPGYDWRGWARKVLAYAKSMLEVE